MKVETIVLSCLKKHSSELHVDNECFLDGVFKYVQDNNIDSLLSEKQSTDTAELLIISFLEPLLRMPSNVLNAYFENYCLIKEFKMISNTVLELAQEKWNTRAKVLLNEDMEERAIHCIAELYSQNDLKSVYTMEISDVILEMDYIKGKTEKISVRLARMVQ